MIKAGYADKKFIVEILIKSFDKNSSVNYIIKQDNKRRQRLKGLMRYSFEMCYHFGSIFYSEDKKGCALVLFPHQKRIGLRSVFLDLNFIIRSLDFAHLKKAVTRENKIKALQAKGISAYLWYIGVDPVEQGKGIGSRLMQEVLNDETMQKVVILETSNLENVRWYKRFGFSNYANLDLGYTLYFMKKENNAIA